MPRPPGVGRGMLSRWLSRWHASEGAAQPSTQPDELTGPDSAFPGTGLGELIARKRHNDRVRQLEFAQLRRLRQAADAPAQAGSEAVSDAASGAGPAGDRGITLRQIDEIEAQMSRQWWQAQGTGAPPAVVVDLPALPVETSPPDLSAVFPHAPDVAAASSPFMPTEPPVSRPAASEPAASVLALPPGEADEFLLAGATPSRLLGALEVAEIVQDPEIEEAAIRFASGDPAGAEAALRALLAPGSPRAGEPQAWLSLLDLFLATGQEAAYDALAMEFAQRFSRSAPAWQAGTGPLLPKAPPAPHRGPALAVAWRAPAEVGAAQVQALDAATRTRPAPWALDLSALDRLREDAVAPLAALLAGWADQPVALHWTGEARWLAVLADATPSGAREVDPAWWQLRLLALRVLGLAEAFELAALDYCITYEVSPPAWEPPRCRTVKEPAEDAPGTEADDGLPRLAGELVGDAIAPALRRLERALAQAGDDDPSDPVAIDCAGLARIDFQAAGELLNWVQAQSALGRSLVFCQVHRLVASLFHVIGLGELAPVRLRGE